MRRKRGGEREREKEIVEKERRRKNLRRKRGGERKEKRD